MWATSSRGTAGRRCLTGLLAFLALAVPACSILNREGPDVTCADLDGGAKNACSDGIIATCTAGEVHWQVCDDRGTCEQDWQVEGRFRCASSDAVPSVVGGAGGVGGTSVVGGAGGSGGAATGGTAGVTSAVAVCGTCPAGYTLAVAAVNDECGGCSCGVAEPGKCAQSVCVVSDIASTVSVAAGACPCETVVSAEHKCSASQVVNVCLPCP